MSTPDDDDAAAAPQPPVFVRPGAPSPAPGDGPVFVLPGAAAPPPGDGPVFVLPTARSARPVDTDRPWRWWVGPLAVFLAFFPALIALYAAARLVIGGGSAALDDNEHWLGLAQDLVWITVALLTPYLVARHLRPGQLGLRRAPLGRSIGVLAGVLVSFYALAAIYSYALGLDENSNTLLQDTGFGRNLTRDIVYSLLFTVAAPVAEELLFRGVLYRSLRDGLASRRGSKTAIVGAAVISGVLFGLAHLGGGQNDFIPVLVALGIVLALAYQWSGTLYVSIGIHSINNAFATGANSTPSADWVYGLIAAGPLLAVLAAFLLSRFVKAVFPQDPPVRAPAPPPVAPSEAPANL